MSSCIEYQKLEKKVKRINFLEVARKATDEKKNDDEINFSKILQVVQLKKWGKIKFFKDLFEYSRV